MDNATRLRTIDSLRMIEQRLPALTGASRRIGEAILQDPWALLGMTIYDVAAMSGVSLPSVTRFCRAVGYPGFRELVQGIAQSLGRIETRDLADNEEGDERDGLEGLVLTVIKRHTESLMNTVRTLDYETFDRVIDAISLARRVVVVGNGSGEFAAQSFAYKLNWAGVPSVGGSSSSLHATLVTIKPDDLVIAISYQGRTEDVMDTLELAMDLGATTVALTSLPDSPIERYATYSIVAGSETLTKGGSFFSFTDSVMIFANVITASIVERIEDEARTANQIAVTEWFERTQRVPPLPLGREQQRHTTRRRRSLVTDVDEE